GANHELLWFGAPLALEDGELPIDQGTRRLEFGYIGDHGQHDAKLAAGSGPEQRSDLRAEQGRAIERDADGAPADGGVLFLAAANIGQHLIATDVERTKYDGPCAGRIEDRLVKPGLLFEPGKSG